MRQTARGACGWPRAAVPAEVPPLEDIEAVEPYTWEILRNGSDCVLLATGTMVLSSLEAADALAADGIRCTVVNCRFLKPYDRDVFEEMVRSHPGVVTVEEAQISNGFGGFMAREINGLDVESPPRVTALGMPDEFIAHWEQGTGSSRRSGSIPRASRSECAVMWAEAPSWSRRDRAGHDAPRGADTEHRGRLSGRDRGDRFNHRSTLPSGPRSRTSTSR